VKPIEKPEAKDDKNEDESRPHDAPKCPLKRLWSWKEFHAFPTLYECLRYARSFVYARLSVFINYPSKTPAG
jgi:hypothetical protein